VYFFERTDGGRAAELARSAWLEPIPDDHLPDQDETRFLDTACASGVGVFGRWEPWRT
jgi:hypothetical protein